MNDETIRIEASVKSRFGSLARDPAAERRFPIGPESAKRLGYTAEEIDGLPSAATESFAGVGNPFALGEIQPGMRVLDLGSGGGMDAILAGRCVAPSGRVLGVDFLPEMISRARRSTVEAGLTNVSFVAGRADALPSTSHSMDVVLVNGVFNLCVDKPAVLAEVFRVLRPGGRLQMADILVESHVTPEELAGKGEWSD